MGGNTQVKLHCLSSQIAITAFNGRSQIHVVLQALLYISRGADEK